MIIHNVFISDVSERGEGRATLIAGPGSSEVRTVMFAISPELRAQLAQAVDAALAAEVVQVEQDRQRAEEEAALRVEREADAQRLRTAALEKLLAEEAEAPVRALAELRGRSGVIAKEQLRAAEDAAVEELRRREAEAAALADAEEAAAVARAEPGIR